MDGRGERGTISFGGYLRRVLSERAMSQAEFSRRVERTPRTVQNWLIGKYYPNPEVIRRIAEILDVDVERLFDQRPPDYPFDIAPTPRKRSALPAPDRALIGREEDVKRIVRTLRNGPFPEIILTGPPGIGKTQMLLNVAAQFEPEYARDSFCYANFPQLPVGPAGSPLDPTHRLLTTIADHFQIQSELVERSLRDRRFFLVFDRFETIAGAEAALMQLLAACLHGKALIASRWWPTAGERVVDVGPLPFPDLSGFSIDPARHSWAKHLTRLAEYLDAHSPAWRSATSVALFRTSAAAVVDDFDADPIVAAAVAVVCARCHGNPGQIVLAAGRCALVGNIVDFLEDEEERRPFGLGRTLAADRDRETIGSVADTYDALSVDAQRLLRGLSVFAGGVTRETARRLWPASAPSPAPRFADLIEELLTARLIGVVSHRREPTRFAMPDPVGEFALSQLPPDEERVWRFAQAGELISMAEAAKREAEAAPKLTLELNNMRAVLSWAAFDERGDATTGLTLTTTLAEFWNDQTRVPEGRQWLTWLIDRAVGAAPDLLALAYHHLGFFSNVRGDEAAAGEAFARGRAWYEASPSTSTIKRTNFPEFLCHEGELLDVQGKVAAARASYQSAIDLYRRSRLDWDPWPLGYALFCLGRLESVVGDDLDLAMKSCQRARRHFHSMSKVRNVQREIADTTILIGALNRAMGDGRSAQRETDRALRLYRELDDLAEVVVTLIDVGHLQVDDGDLDLARTTFAEAHRLARQADLSVVVGDALRGFGRVAFLAGQFTEAQTRYRESLFGKEELLGDAHAYLGLAQVAFETQRFDDALSSVRQAWVLSRRRGARLLQADCLTTLAAIAAAQGARETLERAAEWIGAAQAQRTKAGSVTSSTVLRHEQVCGAQLQERLGADTYAACWRDGFARGIAPGTDPDEFVA